MLKIFSYTSYLLLLLVVNTVSAAGDAAAGKEKSALCAACHGADGNSPNPMWPSLAGQHTEYAVEQLHAFKDGTRENPQMTPMAMPLSDQDIEDLAAYFAAQKAKPAYADPDMLELGERLYRAGNAKTGLAACMACHGPDGAGNPAAKYPSISGQHAEYTAAQLRAFKAEERHNDKNSMMRSVAGKMTNEEIKAVSNYIQGLY